MTGNRCLWIKRIMASKSLRLCPRVRFADSVYLSRLLHLSPRLLAACRDAENNVLAADQGGRQVLSRSSDGNDQRLDAFALPSALAVSRAASQIPSYV